MIGVSVEVIGVSVEVIGVYEGVEKGASKGHPIVIKVIKWT